MVYKWIYDCPVPTRPTKRDDQHPIGTIWSSDHSRTQSSDDYSISVEYQNQISTFIQLSDSISQIQQDTIQKQKLTKANVIMSKTTIEATVTRELRISFHDARKLTTTAKLNLDMTTYPSATQCEALLREVKRIFRKEYSKDERRRMRANNVDLMTAKNPDDMSTSTKSLSSSTDSFSLLSSSSSCSTGLGASVFYQRRSQRSLLQSSRAASMSIDDLSRVKTNKNDSWTGSSNSSMPKLSPIRSPKRSWGPRISSLSPVRTKSDPSSGVSMRNRGGGSSSSRSPVPSKNRERLLCIMTGSRLSPTLTTQN